MMACFAAFEQNKLHQILKIVSISPKRLTYIFLSFSFKFRWLFLYSKRKVPLVTIVSRFCVSIDYKRTTLNIFTGQEQDVHSSVKEEHFIPSALL